MRVVDNIEIHQWPTAPTESRPREHGVTLDQETGLAGDPRGWRGRVRVSFVRACPCLCLDEDWDDGRVGSVWTQWSETGTDRHRGAGIGSRPRQGREVSNKGTTAGVLIGTAGIR